MALILRLLHERDDPRHDLRDEEDRSSAERGGHAAKMRSIQVCAIAHVQSQVALDRRQLKSLLVGWFHVGLDESRGREGELPIPPRPEDDQDREAQRDEARDRDPAERVDATA